MSARRHPRPQVSMIVARGANGVIGKDGDLPWRLPEDLKHFKRKTVGKPIIMGRKTFESLGKPLPARHNIVLTRDASYIAEGCTVVQTLADALDAAGLTGEIMIIGGAQIYDLALPITTRIYLTEVKASPDGDTVFPVLHMEEWRESEREHHPAAGDKPAFAFVTYDRIS